MATRALVATSIAALFVELMLIRWLAAEIPVLGYFKNFPLMAAFIGLGAGALLADRPRSHWLSSLWALVVLSLAVVFTEELGLVDMVFPDPRVDVWSRGVSLSAGEPSRVLSVNLGKIFLVLGVCTWSFVGLGQAIGYWFRQGPALRMYTADIAGSLAGVVSFGVLSYLQTGPQVWLVAAALLLAVSSWYRNPGDRRGLLPLVVLLAIAGTYQVKAGHTATTLRWSPYYRIEVPAVGMETSPTVYQLNVNRDIHQHMVDLSEKQPGALAAGGSMAGQMKKWRRQYDFPYIFKDRPATVLIGGAGSGNNAAAALRNGAGRVTAVEIDPQIIQLGRDLHPEHPYASERVHVVNDDIRSYVRWSHEKYDLIEYGILDSHTALSSLSSLRLDNYVYTVEGIRSAVRRLKPDGLMVLSFYEGNRPWLGRRIFRNIIEATGAAPVATQFSAMCFFVFGPSLDRDRIEGELAQHGHRVMNTFYGEGDVRMSTDDWPFMYSNPAGQPLVYFLSLALLVALASLFISRATRGGPSAQSVRMDWHMFLLGAAFLLIETKALAELSLLFGSTWIVNTLVFSGIFVMVLSSVWLVHRRVWVRLDLAYGALILILMAWYAFPREALNALPFGVRALVSTLLVVLPLLFAGIVFARSFSTKANTAVAFGSNLIGAVIGGAAEATSLAWGIRSLTILALVFYVASWLVLRREQAADPNAADPARA